MVSDKLEDLEHQLRVTRAWILKYPEWRKSEPDPHERYKLQSRLQPLQSRERRLLAKISWHHSVRRLAQLEKILSSPAIDSAPPVSPDLSQRQSSEGLLQLEMNHKTALEAENHYVPDLPLLFNPVFREFPKKWMMPESVEMGLRVPISTASRKKKPKVKQPASGSPPVNNAATAA